MVNRIPFEKLERVNVVGTSGAGKSTFARSLSKNLGHPHIEMDQLFWEPNWTQPTDDIFFNRLTLALDRPRWILDGNYDRSLKIKWQNVTAVIWIDYSFSRTLYQAFTRAFVRGIHRKEMWPGTNNRESLLKAFFSKESIILWTLKTFSLNRARYEQRMGDSQYRHIAFIRLRSPAEARRFLKAQSRLN